MKLTVVLLVLAGVAVTVWSFRNPGRLSPLALVRAGGESYVYGFPLLLTDETRSATLHRVPDAGFIHLSDLPDHHDQPVVRPNRDTLYSIAWLDLGEGPVVLRWPDMGEHYWLFQVLDAWTDVVGRPGSRTHGSSTGAVFLVGPDFDGPTPDGMTRIDVDTRTAWILGRIAVRPHTLDAVRGLQRSFSLVSERASRPLRPASALRPPETITALPPATFFARLAEQLAHDPPRPEDASQLEQLAAIGVVPGAHHADALGLLARWAVNRGVRIARARIASAVRDRQPGANGWLSPPTMLGDYGTDYRVRAGVALAGFGANKPVDAIYPTAVVDSLGEPLDGDHHYELRFAADALPPAAAFWSVTAYDAAGWLMPAAPHESGSLHELQYTERGDLVLTIGGDDGGPNHIAVAPQERFQLTARLYDPSEEAIDGQWTMPPIVRVDR